MRSKMQCVYMHGRKNGRGLCKVEDERKMRGLEVIFVLFFVGAEYFFEFRLRLYFFERSS